LREIHDVKVGEYFIVDSIYTPGFLSLVKKIKGIKHHKVIEKLAPKFQFKNFSWGYFAIPVFN